MRKMSLIQLILSVIASTALWMTQNSHVASSFLIGSLCIWYALFSWGVGMSLIFQKKYIALAVSIIVFKYAVLGVIIYWFVKQTWTSALWFAMGVASFAITALIYAVIEALNEEKHDVI